jgi:aspartyl protease family protein
MGATAFPTVKKGKRTMGLDDSDGDRAAQREREKQQQIDATRAKFAAFSRQSQGAKPPSALKQGLLPMLVFWCAVMGLLYLLMTHYLKPKQAEVRANGDLVIERSQDGHFYATGTLNGKSARFLVDTGATVVAVGEQFSQEAGIVGGTPTTFQTANGVSQGRVVNDVEVAIGPLRVSNVRVGVGLRLGQDNDVLLGQSFLSKFDVLMNKDQLVLRPR